MFARTNTDTSSPIDMVVCKRTFTDLPVCARTAKGHRQPSNLQRAMELPHEVILFHISLHSECNGKQKKNITVVPHPVLWCMSKQHTKP